MACSLVSPRGGVVKAFAQELQIRTYLLLTLSGFVSARVVRTRAGGFPGRVRTGTNALDLALKRAVDRCGFAGLWHAPVHALARAFDLVLKRAAIGAHFATIAYLPVILILHLA